jgi:hypothetical protein
VLKGQLACVSAFNHIGIRESERQATRHCDCRNHDRENLERKRKRLALTVVGFHGFEWPTPDHWIHEFAKSDPLSVKRGSHESLLWVQISR